MRMKRIYFYQRENEYGFDQISIIAFSRTQADTLLKEIAINPEVFLFDHESTEDVEEDVFIGISVEII